MPKKTENQRKTEVPAGWEVQAKGRWQVFPKKKIIRTTVVRRVDPCDGRAGKLSGAKKESIGAEAVEKEIRQSFMQS